MHEAWRTFLYPLGFIASFCFSLRFLIQWIISERKKESFVPPIFWQLSLCANIAMCIHTFIQVQYPFCLIQAINAVISWRNLNLMKEKKSQKTLKFTLFLLLLSTGLISFLFMIEGFMLYGEVDWVRTPTLPWQLNPSQPLSLEWHILGFVGGVIFAMRFWIQWIEIEKMGKSFLSRSFWGWSLLGALLALVYFIKLTDWVNILGYGLGIIPYLRNLFLTSQKVKSP